MSFWKQKKSSLVAVLPAASRDAGRVITSEEAPETPAQRRSRLLSAFNPSVTNDQDSRKTSSLTPSISTGFDRTWIVIAVLGTLLVLNLAVNGWILWKVDQKNPAELSQKIQIERIQEELAQLKLKSETFSRNADVRVKSLQTEFESARDQLQIVEHERRQSLRAYQKPPVYGLNGIVTQVEAQQ